MQPDPKALEELIRRILTVTKPTRIILFGSAARGEMRPDSDLDVLVVPDHFNPWEVSGDIYENLIGFRTPTDVVVATERDLQRYGDHYSLVSYEALRQGRDIYVAEPASSR